MRVDGLPIWGMLDYYTIRIGLTPDELDRLGGLSLVPGMPVESLIQTGERTVISYLVKPIADQVQKAWAGAVIEPR